MAVELHAMGGRYPFGHYDQTNIRASLKIVDGEVRVRIDDIENIDRWEELSGDALELLKELMKPGAERPVSQETNLDR